MSIIKYAIFFSALLSLPVSAGAAASERDTWEYQLEKGTVQYRAKMYDFAILSFQRCIDINPQCYRAANYLAQIYSARGNRRRALDWYRRSLAVNDRQADVQYAAGELAEIFSEYGAAFDHFRRAVELEPPHVKANAALVRFYLERGDRAAAERHFQASYRQAKAVSGALLEKAQEAHREGRNRVALELYRRVIDEAPSLVEAYLGVYELSRATGDYAPAAEALARLTVMRPDHEKAHVLLGYVCFTQKLPGSRKRRIDQAIAALEKAAEINPDNGETCYLLADIYYYLKMDREGLAWEEKGRAADEQARGKKAP